MTEWQEHRRAGLRARIDTDRSQMAPGLQAPSPREESYAQVEQLVTSKSPDAFRQLRNIHTLFFIPMQWLAISTGAMMFPEALSTALC